jgi:hypothetical protein
MNTSSLLITAALFAFGGLPLAFAETPSVVGTWGLESFVRITDSGKEVSWCKEPHGLLTYTQEGYVSASINCSKDTPADAPSQKYENRLLYAGTFTQNSKTQITHHVLNSSDLSIIGRELIRDIESIDGNQLVLTGIAANKAGRFRIVWKRKTPQTSRTGK